MTQHEKLILIQNFRRKIGNQSVGTINHVNVKRLSYALYSYLLMLIISFYKAQRE